MIFVEAGIEIAVRLHSTLIVKFADCVTPANVVAMDVKYTPTFVTVTPLIYTLVPEIESQDYVGLKTGITPQFCVYEKGILIGSEDTPIVKVEEVASVMGVKVQTISIVKLIVFT